MRKRAPKLMPSLKNDAEAENFVESANLSEFDLSGFTPVKFEFERKTAVLNMRLPQNLLSAIKIRAHAEGMPYTRFIRLALERMLAGKTV